MRRVPVLEIEVAAAEFVRNSRVFGERRESGVEITTLLLFSRFQLEDPRGSTSKAHPTTRSEACSFRAANTVGADEMKAEHEVSSDIVRQELDFIHSRGVWRVGYGYHRLSKEIGAWAATTGDQNRTGRSLFVFRENTPQQVAIYRAP